jgi:hypothetical protein
MKLDVSISNYIPKNNSKKNFSHVYMHVPESEELLEVRGKLFSAINVTSKEDIELVDIINEFLDDLEAEYFSDEVSSIVNILDKSITDAYERLSKKIVELNLTSNVDFNVGCFVLWGDIAYMARIGNSSICLYRESKLMNLSEHLLAVGTSIVSTASGYAKDGDVFLLSTSNISRELSDNQIKEICEKNQEDINKLDLGDKNISFLSMKIEATGNEVVDEVLKEDTLEETINNSESITNNNDEEVLDEKNIKQETPHMAEDVLEEDVVNNHVEEKGTFIKNSLNDFDLKGNTKKAYSYIIDTTKDASLNIYKNVNENMKKVDWAGILKSTITVIVSFIQLIFNSIMYLKDRTQKQYKLKINRDLVTLKKEKNTVFGIVIFIILIVIVYYFFF